MSEDGTLPHTALIYDDDKQRDRLIDSCADWSSKQWDSVVVFSSRPDTDSKFFRRMVKKVRPRRGLQSSSMIDLREVLENDESDAADILAILHESRVEPSQGGRRRLVVGNWLHECYRRFDVGLEVEEGEEGSRDLICCYRSEGFWSLDVKHIARIFELHDRIMFGSAGFEQTWDLRRPTGRPTGPRTERP